MADDARPSGSGPTRRQVLRTGLAGAVGLTALGAAPRRLIDTALAASHSGGSLSDVEHIVVLMQENRSFDHYFGSMRGVRGFRDRTSYRSYRGGPATDPRTVFHQTMKGRSVTGTRTPTFTLSHGETKLGPFELVSNPPSVSGQTINDITHDWGPMHGVWNNGAMDRWMVEHLANDPMAAWEIDSKSGAPVPASSKVPVGITAMGYYRRRDLLAFYRAVADAFTICDGYHCSILGPTDPNRLMWTSGSFGAHSKDVGGPVLTTYSPDGQQLYGTLDWPTMAELLTEHDVSWKVYQDPTSNVLFNELPYFRNFANPSTSTDALNASRGLSPVYPAEFAADVAAGTLPSVSWIMPTAESCEHPATPPEYGEFLVSQILQILLTNPAVWERTVFLVVYDENGGFFDHVAPPTPGPMVTELRHIPTRAASLYRNGRPTTSHKEYSTDGEYVTTKSPHNAAGGAPGDWAQVLGPAGLGFRTPALMISPFSAGGWACSDVFDHVSTLKFIEKVFLGGRGVLEHLHVSPWRYHTVGDMTAALPNLHKPHATVPRLPETSLLYPEVAAQAVVNALSGTADYGPAYPPPARNTDEYLKPDRDSVHRRQIPTR